MQHTTLNVSINETLFFTITGARLFTEESIRIGFSVTVLTNLVRGTTSRLPTSRTAAETGESTGYFIPIKISFPALSNYEIVLIGQKIGPLVQ